MRGNLFPSRLVAYKEQGDLEDLRVWGRQLCLVARVQVDTAGDTYPWLRQTDEGPERWHAVGRFWTVLCGPELARAVASGHVTRVGAVAAYAPARLFERFVDHFWALRCAAVRKEDRAFREFAKLLMVALPGKFGQRSSQWEYTGDVLPQIPWGAFFRVVDGKPDGKLYRSIAEWVQVEVDRDETTMSFPAVEAFVNAYGREKMREFRRMIGETNCLYQDTDSLHVTPFGFEQAQALGLVEENALGKFGIRGRADEVTYRGVRDYTWDNALVVSGLKGERRQTGPNAYEVELWQSLDASLARLPDDLILVRREAFRLGALHPRGRLLPDGRVVPALVQEDSLVDPPPELADNMRPSTPGTPSPAPPKNKRRRGTSS